ncbi:MAG: transcription termination/antitermination protein NusG [Candidatus Curtissbacteria bacterium]|nr:transcription termination/antitermination protein NusG [Candidatus Curtissbacteria bacterium]
MDDQNQNEPKTTEESSDKEIKDSADTSGAQNQTDQPVSEPGNQSTEPTAEESSEPTSEPEEAPEQPSEPAETAADEAAETSEATEPASSDANGVSTSEPSESVEPQEEPRRIPGPVADDGKDAKWFVVHTYSGHEAKVAATLKQRVDAQHLQDKILDILVPTQEKIEIKEGKKNTVKEKLFPGYLLIRMILDDNTWLAVRTTPGITSFVGNFNRPTPIPEEEVTSIKRFMQMEAPKFKTAFSIGEAVKIVDGPFSEFLGSISEIDEEKGKLKLMVSIFGRETPVELDFLQVAKL